MPLSANAKHVLNSAVPGHLITIDSDGKPQVSLIYFDFDGNEIRAAHLLEHRKVRNIRRDPRVALSIQSGTKNAIGWDEYLIVHGTARITEGGAVDLLQKITQKYKGPDAVFPTPNLAPTGYITHITIDRISGIGPWTD